MAVGIDINTIKKAMPSSSRQSAAEKVGNFILKNTLTLANQSVPKIENLLTQFSADSCPSEEELNKIYVTRENIIEDANNLSKKLDKFTKTLTGINKFLTVSLRIVKGLRGSKSALQIASTALAIVPFSFPPVNKAIGLANTIAGTLDDVVTIITFNSLGESKLIKKKTALDNAAVPLALSNQYIKQFVDKISQLDSNIQKCSSVGGGASSLILSPVDPQFILISKIEELDEQSPNDTSYQGFTIEIETVPFSPTVDRKRAIGLNNSGIKLIETPLSFASKDQVLINQLKFIIDRDNLKAY